MDSSPVCVVSHDFAQPLLRHVIRRHLKNLEGVSLFSFETQWFCVDNPMVIVDYYGVVFLPCS